MSPHPARGLQIRPATRDDLPAITTIYNDAIVKTTATFDLTPKTEAEQLKWFSEHGERYPVLVAESDGEVLGWASLSEWSGRCAYAATAENSVYVAEAHRGRGIGAKLLATLLEDAKRRGIHSVIARIADENPASVKVHESLGFQRVGVLREVGKKFNRLFDVHIYQIVFDGRT